MPTQLERRRFEDTFEPAMRDLAELQRTITSEWLRAAYDATHTMAELQRLGLETNIRLLEATSDAARRALDVWLATLQDTQQTVRRASRQAERLVVTAEQRLEPTAERVTREAEQAAASASAAARAEREGPERPTINVVKREDDWAVIRENASRATGVFDSKREAVARARELAKRDDAEVNIESANQAEQGGGHASRSGRQAG
jgi:hypothetical protein